MNGIVGYGAYVPFHRLERSAIAAALGEPPGRGHRAVASYDENTTSMGVEAARNALTGGIEPRALYFATADPAYLDKTNAVAVHAALGLDSGAFAADMAGAVRSGVGAVHVAADAAVPTLAVMSDVRTGLPGSADERDGGDGAAALLFADERDGAPVLAEVIGRASATEEVLDRWRLPGEPASHTWEERFAETVYGPLADQALAEALKSAGLTAQEIDHLIVAGVHARAVKRIKRSAGVRPEAVVDDLVGEIGNTGTAHPWLVLADLLDRAEAGQVIAVTVVADGVSVLLLRATEALVGHTAAKSVRAQVAAGRPGLAYATFLSWRGHLHREPPRRPDPEAPAAPPSFRRADWKFGFAASRCTECGGRHLPPSRVCSSCDAVDRMETERLSEVGATVATFTADRLAWSPNPPMVMVVLDFDGGGRYRCELTDADPEAVAIGDRVEMTFRRAMVAGGVHNYVWKARPVRSAAASKEDT
jgi:hydroxymethylglutaryl-CoA synthase